MCSLTDHRGHAVMPAAQHTQRMRDDLADAARAAATARAPGRHRRRRQRYLALDEKLSGVTTAKTLERLVNEMLRVVQGGSARGEPVDAGGASGTALAEAVHATAQDKVPTGGSDNKMTPPCREGMRLLMVAARNHHPVRPDVASCSMLALHTWASHRDNVQWMERQSGPSSRTPVSSIDPTLRRS
eukprot:TRINITY_DN846_c0_g1_i5.p1 TRINITY_DN846_c0_g1~~TRINITY_DN846_c0_g1_i5.p1  ORF type:complete len:186 (+),score=44.36 TRINITY_DN846_c0_g1_i5:303-860(+)